MKIRETGDGAGGGGKQSARMSLHRGASPSTTVLAPHGAVSMSMNVAWPAPREIASSPIAPVPANPTGTRAPSIEGASWPRPRLERAKLEGDERKPDQPLDPKVEMTEYLVELAVLAFAKRRSGSRSIISRRVDWNSAWAGRGARDIDPRLA